ACFLRQLSHGASQPRFAWVDLAGRKLEHHARQWIAVLALHHEAAVVEHGHDHHCTGMHDVFTRGRGPVGQAHMVAANVEQLAQKHLLGVDGLFAQMYVGGGGWRGHVASVLTIASTHTDIRPPGIRPKSSTAAPLSDRMARTSVVATMGDVSVGSSKYMLFTRRM